MVSRRSQWILERINRLAMTKKEAFKTSCDLLRKIFDTDGNVDIPLFATILNAQADNDTETIVKILDELRDFIGKLINQLDAE